MRMLGKAYLNIFHDFCFTTDHGVSQFEDRLTVQTTLAMLRCDVSVCGGGRSFASVMSIVGDYPVLINEHAPSFRLYLNFKPYRKTTAFCVNPSISNSGSISFKKKS